MKYSKNSHRFKLLGRSQKFSENVLISAKNSLIFSLFVIKLSNLIENYHLG